MTDRERNVRWYLKHREELSARYRAYYLAHKERITEQSKLNNLQVDPMVRKLTRCLGVSRSEARAILGQPQRRRYTKYE